jgi:hypothetical protein
MKKRPILETYRIDMELARLAKIKMSEVDELRDETRDPNTIDLEVRIGKGHKLLTL